MERSDLTINMSESARRQFQTATAQNRIMDCLSKKLPISEIILEGLDLLSEETKSNMLSRAEVIKRIMETPLSASIESALANSSIGVQEALERLKEERKITPEILTMPLDAAWLITLPAAQREEILNQRQKDLKDQNHIAA